MSARMFSFGFHSDGLFSKKALEILKNSAKVHFLSRKACNYSEKSYLTLEPLNFQDTFYGSPGLKILQNNSLINKIMVRYMAGHAKWQNVMHIKAAGTQLKNRLCDKYCRLVRYAILEGGPDPKLNSKLADVIAEAHRHNVSNSTLDGVLKASQKVKTKTGSMEIIGPGGCYIILEYESANISDTRHQIKTAVRKHGGAIPSGDGRWRAVYDQKGLIRVIGKADGELDSEQALNAAIEAGAEDVQVKKDENDKIYLEFFSAPDDLHPVKKELETMKYKIEEAYIAYIPNVMVELSGADMEAAGNLINELEDMSDTVRVYENVH